MVVLACVLASPLFCVSACCWSVAIVIVIVVIVIVSIVIIVVASASGCSVPLGRPGCRGHYKVISGSIARS